MTTLSDLYSPIPYNVMVTPPLKEGKYWDQFKALIKELKGGWNEFEKTGYSKPYLSAIDEALKIYKGGDVDYTALVKSFLSIGSTLGEFIPGGTIIVPIFNGLVDLIFPHLFGSKEADNNTKFFNMIIAEVAKMIDKSIQDLVIELDTNTINGIGEAAKLLQTEIQTAIGAPAAVFGPKLDAAALQLDSCSTSPCKTPTVDALKKVENQFIASTTTIATNIPSLLLKTGSDRNAQRQTVMLTLPMYVTGATLHLSLIQGYIQFMQQWKDVYAANLSSAISSLKRYIVQYSNTVLTTYNNYNKDIIPTINNKNVLNKYIQYNRVMTIQVFDLVSMWPSFFPADYPSTFNTDQTRIAFGNIAGPTEDQPTLHFDLYDVYGNKLPNNDIFNYFYNGMQLNTFELAGAHSADYNRVYTTGINARYNTYNTTNSIAQYAYTGPYIKNFSEQDVLNLTNINILSVKTKYQDINKLIYNCQSYNPEASRGYQLNGCDYSAGYTPQVQPKNVYVSANVPFSNQKIQAIYPVASTDVWGGKDKRGYLYTLVDYDLFPQNVIGQPNEDGLISQMIQGFPAEKGFISNNIGTLQLVPEPINSAAAVNLKFQQILSLPITNLTVQNYQIRVRYANKSDNTIYFRVETPNGNLNSGPQTLKNAQDTTNITIKGNNGDYTLQTLADKVFLPSGNLTVHFQNNSNSDLFLDRIEFVPLPLKQEVLKPTDINIFKGSPDPIVWESQDKEAVSAVLNVREEFGMPVTNFVFDFYLNNVLQFSEDIIGGEKTYMHNGKTFNKITGRNTNPVVISDTLIISGIINEEYSRSSNIFETPEDLELITNQVNSLFTSSLQTELVNTVTDYGIDQVVMKVDALSDDVFGVEKKALRKLVNQAKQLSKARNVLVGGNFEKGHEWVLGREATTVANHDLFKGDHLLLPPPTMDPSYAYQKIDESKLQPNTRYTVSGFIAQSEHLEVIVSRYGKEISTMLDVPYEEALPISSDENPNCCKPAGCQCQSCHGDAPDSHFFSYSIDVGSLQPDVNLGIEFGLRIAKPNGFAKISNLEIKEDRPLTDQEIKKVQRKEQKWKKAFDKEQAELKATLQPTLDQINALYQHEDWNGSIHPHVMYQHLSDVVVPTLPKQTHWFMEDREGEHVVLTQQFQQALDRAFQQIEEQNLLHNGNFANGVTDWTVTGDAHVVSLEDGDQVLELSHWDASVSQTIEIIDFEEEKEYKLRVRGKSKGTVTIQHGEEELKTMTFNTTSFTTQEQTFYFEGNTVDVHVQSENNVFLVDSVELIEVVEEQEEKQ
ncbi:insecticidal delta-endotoxin Cry8Ea1 family protein [Bacillus thuringiensis]|uniref:insecticidal delta-endotoxin Cry8Ea1 family protein n=1 Tax=Bacillus thuringiensis TaxID=1428 RepID=UPI0013DF42C6|nr:insecticidal delta-endotoxin Cry8Ea1 family protein [Bacillus thuringiensis]